MNLTCHVYYRLSLVGHINAFNLFSESKIVAFFQTFYWMKTWIRWAMLGEGQMCEVPSPLSLVHSTSGLASANVIRSVEDVGPGSSQEFLEDRPPRPFSNPTKSLQFGPIFQDENNSDLARNSEPTQVNRPSSTPTQCDVRLGVSKHTPDSYVSRTSGILLDETLIVDERVEDLDFEKSLSQEDTPWDSCLVTETTVSCVSPGVTVVSSGSQLLTDDYTQPPSPSLPNIFSPFRPISNLTEKKVSVISQS